ncbi:hypothetical protein [Leisingera sp. M658]|nr:hypothetical protein [Leisingera sp. M658]UWQ77480.1 hypothetical protein K3724_23135 [Leisingera sp. M658]
MAISTNEKLEIYRLNLTRYEANGDTDKADVERRLIARLEREMASQKARD